MKIRNILIIICGLIIFSGFVFLSSPYRELRPYMIAGKKLPEKSVIPYIEDNKGIKVFIEGDEDTGSFYMDQIPVTIKQYKNCTKAGGCATQHYNGIYTKYFDSKYYGDCPVSFVTWDEAHDFCAFYGGDLPTMAQWEAAAGAGYGYDYAWGNDMPTLSTANLDGYYQFLTPAGWLPRGASPYGILDMTGNVREWIIDDNHSEDFGRGLKGGSYQDAFSSAKNETVFYHQPTSSGFNRGVRCVYNIQEKEKKKIIQVTGETGLIPVKKKLMEFWESSGKIFRRYHEQY